MARCPSSRKPTSAPKAVSSLGVDLYQCVTDTIIAQLEQDRVLWVQPWGDLPGTAAVGIPRNAVTGRRLLWDQTCCFGRAAPLWPN